VHKLQPQHRKALVLELAEQPSHLHVLKKLGLAFGNIQESTQDHSPYEQLTPEVLEENLLIINTSP